MSSPQQAFPPTLREVMLRAQWIGVLFLCLLVAGVFAWLGQWQLSRAIDTDPVPVGVTEEVRPLEDVITPGEYLPEPFVGQKVELSGTWVAEDFIIVSSRMNDDREGFWVTGQLRIAARTSIAVALGWAPDREAAETAVALLDKEFAGQTTTLTGRIISDEGTQVPPADEPDRLDRMSTAMLLGKWHDVDQLEVYRPYLTAAEPLGGLETISSPAPEEIAPVNWLNLFYAAEWVVFAGFAFYFWYRLAKDAWEREVELFEETA